MFTDMTSAWCVSLPSPFAAHSAVLTFAVTESSPELQGVLGFFFIFKASDRSVRVFPQLLRRGGLQVPDPHAGGGGRRRGLPEAGGKTQTEDQHGAVLLLLPLPAICRHYAVNFKM